MRRTIFGEAMGLSKQGDELAAIKLFKRDIAQRPYCGLSYLSLARSYQATDQYHFAVQIYQNAIEKKLELAKAYVGLARCYEEMEQPANVLKTYENAFKLFPTDQTLLLSLIRFCQKTGKHQAASSLFEKLRRQNPTNRKVLMDLVRYYEKTRQFELALEILKELQGKYPADLEIGMGLVRCYEKIGQLEKALKKHILLIKQHPHDKALLTTGTRLYEKCEKQFASDRLFSEDITSIAQALFSYQHALQVYTPISPALDSGLSSSTPAQLTLPQEVLIIMTALEQQGYSVYLYGGSVRNGLLGMPVKDFDLKTTAPQTVIEKVFPNCQKSMHRENLYTLKLQKLHFDINYSPLEINEHAKALDFTINAFYCDKQGHIIYSLPTGWRDLQTKMITLIGNVNRLAEDPIKMLRAIYLAAKLDFTINPAMAEYISRQGKHILKVKQARLAREFSKLFLQGYAYQSYFQLKAFHLLELLFPVLTTYSNAYEQWLNHQPTLTDQRAHVEQPISLNYIYALFLLNGVIGAMVQTAPEKILWKLENVEKIIDNVVETYQPSLSLQERQVDVVKRLLIIFYHQYLQNPNCILLMNTDSVSDKINERIVKKVEPLSLPQTVKETELKSMPPSQHNNSQQKSETITFIDAVLNLMPVPEKSIELSESQLPMKPLKLVENEDTALNNKVINRSRKKFSRQSKSPIDMPSKTPIDCNAYAFELLTTAIPESMLVRKEDRKKALTLLEYSLNQANIKIKLPAKIEERIKTLIYSAIYKRSWWDYTSPTNWSSLFFCENYGIHFNAHLNPNALTVVNVRKVIQEDTYLTYHQNSRTSRI